MRLFLDRPSALGKMERTPVGGARIPAILARVGVMEYLQDGRTIRQYNPPEVLAAAAASAADCPVTLHHPRERAVDSANYARESRGHVSGAPTPSFDPTTGLLSGVLVIQSPDLIAAIETGATRQVSMGYSADIDETPGITPDGQEYDWVRTRIVWNHAAVVPEGRAGVARLLLDSEGASLLSDDDEEIHMPFKLDGIEITQDAAQALVDALRAELESARANSSAEALSVLVDAAVATREREAAEAAEAARKAAESSARRDRAAKAYPSLSLDSKSDDYVSALIDRLDADTDGIAALRGGVIEVGSEVTPKKPEKSQRAAFLDAQRALWKRPISDG